jgi:hypothetical protein
MFVGLRQKTAPKGLRIRRDARGLPGDELYVLTALGPHAVEAQLHRDLLALRRNVELGVAGNNRPRPEAVVLGRPLQRGRQG